MSLASQVRCAVMVFLQKKTGTLVRIVTKLFVFCNTTETGWENEYVDLS